MMQQVKVTSSWAAALALVAFLCGSVARAATESPATGDGFDAKPELVRAAKKLFAPEAGDRPVVELRNTIERYSAGFRYDIFGVLRGGKALGTLVRIQVYPDPASHIDFAVRVSGETILGAEPIRPIVLAGKPFEQLPALFAPLKGERVSAYSGALARFFHALAFAEQGAAGPRPAPSVAPGTPPLVVIRQAEPAPGDPLPKFTGKRRTGKALDSSALAGKPAAVVFASLKDGKSRDLLESVAGALAGVDGWTVLVVLEDDVQAIAGLEANLPYRETLLADAIAEPSPVIAPLFRVSTWPYLLLYDRKGKLSDRTWWHGPRELSEAIRAAVDLDRKEGGR